MADVTEMLNAHSERSPGENRERELFAHLYGELRRLARSRMANERAGDTLNSTGLAHEAWLRLEGGDQPPAWRDRNQFFSAAIESMRRILIERARRRFAAKRGGGEASVPLDENEVFVSLPDERLLAVHAVLDRLESENPAQARIVKLRYFGGLKHDEIAELLDMNEKTVRRHWAVAKVWLYRALQEEMGET